MITVKSAEQLEQEKQAGIAQRKEQEQLSQSMVVDQLAAYVKKKWTIAKNHKLGVTTRLTDCLRRRRGIYSPEKLEAIKSTGGSDIYMNITANKCIGAKAWLSDLFSSDRPFTIEPTPVPDLPPEMQEQLITQTLSVVMQTGLPEEQAMQIMKQHEKRLKGELNEMAEERMEEMADYLDDIMIEGNWRKVFDEFLDDLVTYPTAVISGINFKARKKVKWVEINGEHVPKKEITLSREFERVSPFDAYPSPTTDSTHQTWFCQHVRYTPEDLANMRKAKGYNADAIYRVLADYRMNGRKEWLFNSGEREKLEGKQGAFNTDYDLIDGVKFSGSVQGQQLISWGMNPQSIPDPMDEYCVSVVVIGNHTIRALINPDPAGKINYYWTSFRPVPGSFWGEALPESISDCQDACNATARSLINNMAMASGPMVAYDVGRLPKGQVVPKIKPWGMFPFDSTKAGGAGGAGVSFFMPDTKANELLSVYERFARYADEQSGIPQYAFGSDSGAGAAKTASGLSMLMNAASKTIKNVVRNIDIDIIEPVIRNLYNTAMLDPEVPSDIKGDAQVKARGSDSLMHKEAAAMRQQELLQITNNPVDHAIFNPAKRRDMYEQLLKNLDMPAERIMPTEQEMQQQMLQQQQAALMQSGDENAQ